MAERTDVDPKRLAAECERQRRELGFDATIEASFPASGPLSTDPNPIGRGTIRPEIRERGGESNQE